MPLGSYRGFKMELSLDSFQKEYQVLLKGEMTHRVPIGTSAVGNIQRLDNGECSCSIDLLIELSCILHVSTDYLLMGSEPSKEEVKNDLLSIISELSTIAKKI